MVDRSGTEPRVTKWNAEDLDQFSDNDRFVKCYEGDEEEDVPTVINNSNSPDSGRTTWLRKDHLL